jgi:hypothetical protein
MSVYAMISSLLSYVFTTIIYLFIFSVIGLIYMDIKKMGKNERSKAATVGMEKSDNCAMLKTVKGRNATEAKLKAKYRINQNGVIVGRGKDCDIRINHAFVSAEHFQVWYDEGDWYIGDMGSKNGTYLNGTKLKKVRTLKDGDEISFGEIEFVFEEAQG